MNRKKTVRIAGFVAAVGASAALVAAASSGTGAYFEDSHGGNLQASSGQLKATASDTYINFAGLNPGQDRTQRVHFGVKSNSTSNADIWLVFNTASEAYGRFTGAGGTSYGDFSGGGMGQYGHFKVVANAGGFESYNLQLPDAADATKPYSSKTARNTCSVDKYGHGGSPVQHAPGGDNDIAECGVPGAILLQKNMAPGASGYADVTFGLTGKQELMNQKNDPNVPFEIVATQPGIAPGAAW